ncbi:MAG: valine--tRNA ligase, partial [Candidatus Paceibacterota bacterium]
HMGHAYSYSLFDMVSRFKRMNGFNVLLPIGFDDNGHPTERYVEKKHNIKSSDIPREKFIALCREETEILEKTAKSDIISLGLGFDWSRFYSTISDDAIKTAQYSFIDLYRKKLVYRAEEPSLWCTDCKTALAQADVEDAERNTLLNYIKFGIDGKKTILIATTRPEFLPACVAVFVNPQDKRYKSLIGKTATVPLFGQKVKIMSDGKVDPEFGTGIVMVCTFGDKTDIEWWKNYKLPLKLAITEDGKMNEIAGEYKGLKLIEARKKIIESLREKGILEKQENLKQTVGICWRCHTPVEFFVTKQWKLKLLEHKKEFIDYGRKIKWHPSFFIKRYEDWVNGLNWDWLISRQRHYGVPLPVWYCKKCGKEVIADEKQLPANPLKDKPKSKCSCGSGDFYPDKDVFDTWFTSSLTPEIVLKWTEDKDFAKNLPEDLRPQGYEIIRTWAFYTIVKSIYHFKSIPWKNIMVNGMILDAKGKAMHKSAGNAIEPSEALEKFSADAMRFWAASSKLGEDIPYQEKELVSGQKTITKLWNAAKFVSPSLEKISKPKKMEEFDLWILSKLNSMIESCTESFENYEYSKAKAEIENFFWHTFCDNYLEIIKKRIYQPEAESEKISAQYALYNSLLSILKIFAPIMPHITEEIYQEHFRKFEKEKSIHISEWPAFDKKAIDKKLEEKGDIAIDIIGKVRHQKSVSQKSMKAEIILTIEKDKIKALGDFIKDLKAVTAAKEIREGAFAIEFL